MGFERKRKIIANFLIVLIIALLAFTGYIMLVNNSKFKIKTAIRYVFNRTDTAIGLVQNSPMSNAILNNKTELTNRIIAKISLSDDAVKTMGPVSKNIEDLINNSSIDTNIKTDVANKYMDLGINYSYNNEKTSANAYLNNNELYIFLKGYFDKYLKFDTADFSADQVFNEMTSGIKVDEIRYLMNILKQSVADSIDYGTITTSKTSIDIYEDKVPVNKTTITIDTKLKNKATIIFLNKISHDNKAMAIVLKLSDSSKYPTVDYLKNDIMDELSNLETKTFDNKILGEYSIYTSGIFNNVVRNELKTVGGTENVIQITTYKTDIFDTQISVYENNELTFQSNIKGGPNDNYDIAITSGKAMSLDIKGVISQPTIDVTYLLKISGADDVKGDITLKTNNVSKNEINQTFNAKLNTPESYGTANLTIETTLKIVDEIIKPDFSNNVKINALTTNQTNTIMTNFQNKNPKLIKAISNIISSLLGM